MNPIDPHWWWFGAGVVLAALEMLAPGVYLIYLALAALVTGVLVLTGDPSVPMQLVTFVALSLIFAFSAKRWLREKPIESSDPLMNDRVGRLIGQTAVVTQAIDGGEGRVRIADGEWLANGPDCPAGTRVRISGANGACLNVEALELTGPDAGATPEAG